MPHLKKPSPHDSIRGYAAQAVWELMAKDDKVVLVTGDLGFGMLDFVRDDFAGRVFNPGAAEMAGLGMCVGMALCGLKPIFYTINNFGSWRVAEIIRNYLDHEKIPVTILLSGADNDYAHDGWSHNASDLMPFLGLFKNVVKCVPKDKQDAFNSVKAAVNSGDPSVIILRR